VDTGNSGGVVRYMLRGTYMIFLVKGGYRKYRRGGTVHMARDRIFTGKAGYRK